MATSGQERGVVWVWVGDLDFTLDNDKIPAHGVHAQEVSAVKGNTFYGSFSLVSNNGATWHGDQVILAHPTKKEHTEPQYFAWLIKQFERPEILLMLLNTKAIILEINQTNTPCSGAHCRPHILHMVKAARYGKAFFIGRLSAFQVYESQYPAVTPHSGEVKALRAKKASVKIDGPAVIHRVVEYP